MSLINITNPIPEDERVAAAVLVLLDRLNGVQRDVIKTSGGVPAVPGGETTVDGRLVVLIVTSGSRREGCSTS
jgi:hypothetical protein